MIQNIHLGSMKCCVNDSLPISSSPLGPVKCLFNGCQQLKYLSSTLFSFAHLVTAMLSDVSNIKA